ncbi:MAG: ATP-binding protein [Blastocatellia bacterium]|nr:ATP-binding protein [Blastocatellia bacterium]
MIGSLRLRVLSVTVIVSVVAVAAVALFSSRVTSVEFERFVTYDEEASLERFGEVLTTHYRQNESWQGIQAVLERVGKIAGKRLLLIDQQGRLIAAWPEELLRADVEVTSDHTLHFRLEIVEDDPRGGGRILRQEKYAIAGAPHVEVKDLRNATVATLYLAATREPGEKSDREVFVGTVNRSLILAVLIAGGAALIAALLLLRRILGPVEQLTEAARQMEKGDLSRRVEVRSKDEIGELSHAFNAMAESLARIERLRRNMVSDIAHELRAPLTNIRCQIEALQDGLMEPGPEVIDSLHEETLLLARLIDDLQELALADAGQLSLVRYEVSVPDAINRAVGSLQSQAAAKKLAIDIHAAPDLPAVYADPERVGQILRNLLTNAINYTPPDGLIEVRARRIDSEIEVSVSDTGPGIEPEHLPFVFERFYRSEGSRSRATGGAGLGLAIVKQLVTAHGGQVRAERAPGKGSTFFFTLPVSRG